MLLSQFVSQNPVSANKNVSFSAHKNTTNQTGVAGNFVLTKVTFTTEDFDTNSNYDAANSKFTPTVAGKYLITANITNGAAMADNDFIYTFIYKNGAAYKYQLQGDNSQGFTGCLISTIVDLNGTTDYIEIYTTKAINSTWTIDGTITATYFQGILISPNSADAPNTPKDITLATTDYPLKAGETVFRTFTSATSVPLNIATVEGLYEMNINYINLAASPTNNNITLSPNNTTTAANAVKSQHTDVSGSTLTTGQELRTTFDLGYGGGIQYRHNISTFTAGKSVLTFGYFKFNNGTYEQHTVTEYWADTSTVWSSLGTITFPTTLSGVILIKRLL